jgi:hypothetical protein
MCPFFLFSKNVVILRKVEDLISGPRFKRGFK